MKFPALLLATLVSLPDAPQPTPRPFRSRVEVAVRSVRVVLTTKDGKPLAKPPSPNDLEVLEGGQKAEILDVERLFTAGLEGQAPKPAEPAEAAPAPRPVPHVVYLETTLISTNAVKEAVRSLDATAPRLVARGPVEIVVADPEPKTFLEPTRDLAAVRASLARVRSTVVGRDALASQRFLESEAAKSMSDAEAARTMQEAGEMKQDAKIRSVELLEKNLVIGVVDRLTRWAAGREPQPGGVFVLVSDGFDLDPARFAERMVKYDTRRGLSPRPPDLQLKQTMADASAVLGSLGFAVFPLTVGAATFHGTAESGARSLIDVETNPEAATIGASFENRAEPLALAAASTGGEVARSGEQLGQSLERLSESYLITFQPARPADGKIHTLQVRARRDDVVVRAPNAIAGGTPESTARAVVLGLLAGDPPPSDMGVEAALEHDAAAKTSTLRLRIRLGKVPELLAAVGEGRLRVSVALARGKNAPFVKHDEVPLKGSGEGRIFVFEAPMAGALAGDRLAVFVEELETGLAGGATLTVSEAPKK